MKKSTQQMNQYRKGRAARLAVSAMALCLCLAAGCFAQIFAPGHIVYGAEERIAFDYLSPVEAAGVDDQVEAAGVGDQVEAAEAGDQMEAAEADDQVDEAGDQVDAVEEQIRILFIGNSFSHYHSMNRIFADIGKSYGLPVKVERLASDGYYLNQFASPKDTLGFSLSERLSRFHDYQAVILQEQSLQPILNYEDFLQSARILCGMIRNTQENVKIYFYETWGYEAIAWSLRWTVPEMEQHLREAYERAAQELNVCVSPVGKAFSYVYRTCPNIELYSMDYKHPSYAGSYLAACVHAAVVLGVDIRECNYYGELDEETARALQDAAYHVVNDVLPSELEEQPEQLAGGVPFQPEFLSVRWSSQVQAGAFMI